MSITSNSKVLVNPQSIKKKMKSESMSLQESDSIQILNAISGATNNNNDKDY